MRSTEVLMRPLAQTPSSPGDVIAAIIAFALSFPPHLIIQLIASLLWLLTAVLALIAFAIQM